jgi:DNA-binding NtrC family response regulator
MADTSAGTVLVVDDEKGVRQVISSLLEKANYATIEAEDGQKALQIASATPPDAVLLDIRMPGLDGFDVLERLKASQPDLPVILVTAFDHVETAVKAMHMGAYDYLTKPLHGDEVVVVVQRAIEHRRLSHEVRSLHQRLSRETGLATLLGPSQAVARLSEHVNRVAATNLTALLTGERDTGMELAARAIHNHSQRCQGPFVAVDCGALPAELIEGELFGHGREALPAAGPLAGERRPPRQGRFDLAGGGTLYLADVGALSLTTQGSLLRFLQDGHIVRVGGSERIPLDVRVVADAAVDLRELVAGHLFRRDLYVRLAECTLAIPPLRERPEDIVYLVKRFLDETNRELGKAVQGPTPEALDALLSHSWPGNLRELRQTIRRAVLLATERIEPAHLGLAARPTPQPAPPDEELALPLHERTRRAVERTERDAIAEAIRRASGNKSAAARILGIDYKTLHVKMKRYNVRGAEDDANGRHPGRNSR